MHRRRFTVAVLACLLAACLAPAARADELTDLRDLTQARTYQDADGHKLLYRLFVPKNYDPNKKYAMVLFLHGAGERGNDNSRQLLHPDALNLVTDKVAAKYPAFLVAPQCPSGQQWANVRWSQKTPHETTTEPSESMRLALELVDVLQKEFSIDPDRRYVTGLSMGGYGTFDAVARRPDYWAAAVPLCGGADDSKAASFAHVPLWIFHGSKDGAVPVERSRSVVAALKKAGGEPKYTEYEGAGHGIWKQAYAEPGLPEWLFSKTRKEK